MPDRKAVDPRAIVLYDEYTHTAMGRRAFLRRLARIAGGAAAAAALLPLLDNDYSRAVAGGVDDPSARSARATLPGPAGDIVAYVARPATGSGPWPGVVVIHENRGLNPHIEDVARRLAAAGFLAVAPDGLSRAGGTPADADRAREMIGDLGRADALADYMAAVRWTAARKDCSGKVGCVGFCWGGAMAGELAANLPALAAAVAYYGRQPAAADVPRIAAPILLHYAGLDERINAGIDEFRTALDAAGKRYELHVYEGVNHAFNNDTNVARYDAAAAALAWQRTLTFLRCELAAG